LQIYTTLKSWGIRTLGDLTVLPSAELASRFGQAAAVWQSLARGEDVRPLVPTLADERFEERLDLEWPIEGAEPLSFVLTRLLEPLSARLERRDRGVAVLHVELGLVTREIDARRLQLPSPMRDVRALRTLVLLDLESHPPPAAIDRVAIIDDPTPGRIVQHTLYARAQPAPEQVSTLVARLGALMGQDRLGVPVIVDSHRPGAFAMQPFAVEYDDDHRRARKARREISQIQNPELQHQPQATSHQPLVSALRRCRQPVPARVTIGAGRPLRVMTDRRGFAGGSVVAAAGPWRISGEWWEGEDRGQRAEGRGQRAGGAGQAGRAGEAGRAGRAEGRGQRAEGGGAGAFNRDEWDVRLTDGAVYRIFRDCDTDGWFIEAIVD
jgi:protein ImuB